MWSRIKRLFRSIFGGIIDKAEDPELVLQQVIRDMRDKVPQMNENVAQVMATQKLLEKETGNLEREITSLDAKVKAAIKQGRDDIARTYISAMQEKRTSMTRSAEQLELAKKASQQAVRFRDNYILEMKKRTSEAMQLIAQSRQAKIQEQLAQTMASFQMGDEAGSFDEMRDKINRRAAAAEAKMELSTTGIDAQLQDIERDAANIEVDDTLAAYKREMGLVRESAPVTIGSDSAGAEKTLGPAEKSKALE
ncbi:MAG TPA: PspA/IM30 family protein [Blastocatellia bacterium]|nr:PspA/IM30 family protein [Blastocatellia bacterium]